MKPQTQAAVESEEESINKKIQPTQSPYVLLHPEKDAGVSTDVIPFYDPEPDTIRVDPQDPQDSELKKTSSEQQNETKTTPLCNKRFLTNTALKTYSLERFDKNVMIIFNHNKVKGYSDRRGTEYDVANLRETFGKYNFHLDNVIEHNDLNRGDLKAVLKQFSRDDFGDFGCLLVVVLSHGQQDGYLWAKDYVYHESELIDPLTKNPTLANKPKIFIIQACRGDRRSEAAVVGKYINDMVENEDEDLKMPLLHTLPRQPDVLVLHSTYAGFVSYRDTQHGSWIIQSLCRNIDELGDKEHLEDILRAVKYDVAIHKQLDVYSRHTGETEMHKQMPVVMSTLRKKLYFKKSLPDDKNYEDKSSVQVAII